MLVPFLPGAERGMKRDPFCPLCRGYSMDLLLPSLCFSFGPEAACSVWFCVPRRYQCHLHRDNAEIQGSCFQVGGRTQTQAKG